MNNYQLVEMQGNEEDYQLLYKWCSQEYIYEWFEQRKLSYDEIIMKYQQKLSERKQDLFFIEINDEKIGFVQIYQYPKDLDFPVLENYSNIYEYDIFIGEIDYVSKGYGSDIIPYINKYIYRKYQADAIILRVFKRNTIALKCYEKAHFKVLEEYFSVDTIGNKEEMVLLINEKR